MPGAAQAPPDGQGTHRRPQVVRRVAASRAARRLEPRRAQTGKGRCSRRVISPVALTISMYPSHARIASLLSLDSRRVRARVREAPRCEVLGDSAALAPPGYMRSRRPRSSLRKGGARSGPRRRSLSHCSLGARAGIALVVLLLGLSFSLPRGMDGSEWSLAERGCYSTSPFSERGRMFRGGEAQPRRPVHARRGPTSFRQRPRTPASDHTHLTCE